jgi:hypothetical protein
MFGKDRLTESIALSMAWCDYFAANRLKADELPWGDAYRLTPSERRAIQKSVQQFQLGEGAEGRRLLAHGRANAAATGDSLIPEALTLFIREEQRHSAQLLKFMRLQGIPAVEKHWVDSVFRWVRVLAGLEVELRVLVTAEVIAVPYYRALGCATRSALLQSISARILGDEAEHLRFQASMLCRLEAARVRLLRRLVWQAHRWFLVGTCCVVWIEHRSVFKAAGRSFLELLRDALAGFSGLEAATASKSNAPPRTSIVQGDRAAVHDITELQHDSPVITACAEVPGAPSR